MDYHAHHISEDGVLRMLADGSAFRNIKERWSILKKNLVMLGFHWQLKMSINLVSLGVFTRCGIFCYK
jgi:hypothetical protein